MKLVVPNIKKMFIPNTPGHRIYEIDLQGADARVVAWESDDIGLKETFRAGSDIHAVNAFDIWPNLCHDFGISEFHFGMFKTDIRLKPYRFKAKTGVHAVDYGCKAATLAEHLNISRAEAQGFIDRWFFKHPNIKAWHQRIENQLFRQKYVSNVWGYKRHYFDRPEGLLPEALAWIGQSTTAIAINRLMVKLHRHLGPRIAITNQTHDSVTFQCSDSEVDLEEVQSVCKGFTVPYEDPMEMPVEIASSLVSWGDCKEIKP